jgi:nucleotide-binding universal stress UspA family protein
MIKRILIPSDGSPNSAAALEYGLALASFFDAEITGLHVIDIRALEGPFFSDISGSLGFSPIQNYLPRFQQILDERADTILDIFKNRCADRGLIAKTKKMTGIIANIIADEARKAELVVISQHGEHEQWSSGLLGSTTESVVRKSPVPVLVTPGTYRQFDTILVAYDGSIESSNALKCACSFFGNTCKNMHVVYVAHEEEKGRALAAEIAEITAPYSVTYEGVWLQGDAPKEILLFADLHAVDLIIMGAFSHGRLHDLIIGSTAAYIIRKSTIPILLHR